MVHCDELVPDQDLAGEYARFLDSEDDGTSVAVGCVKNDPELSCWSVRLHQLLAHINAVEGAIPSMLNVLVGKSNGSSPNDIESVA